MDRKEMRMIRRAVMALSGVAAASMLALSPAAVAQAVTWQVSNTPAIALPDSAADAWGLSANASGTVFAEHWNGTAWASMQMPATAQESAIAADGPHDAWVVGSIGAAGYNRHQPFMTHYNGSSWTAYAVPDDGANERLTSVAVLSPDNVWAAGPNAFMHWNSTSWSRVTPPAPPDATGTTEISSLYGSGTDLWALETASVGSTTARYLARWDGTSWSLTAPLPAPASGHWWQIGNISATSPTNAWVAVTDNDPDFDTTALALHWNGSAWSTPPMPVSGVQQTLSSIAAGSGEAWAVGTYERSWSDNASQAAVYRWDGSHWSVVSFPVSAANSAATAVAYVPGSSTVWVSGAQSSGSSYSDFVATD
jgi:hypothetical protein